LAGTAQRVLEEVIADAQDTPKPLLTHYRSLPCWSGPPLAPRVKDDAYGRYRAGREGAELRVSPPDLDQPKWHTGALYDAIWEFDLPPIVLTEGKRAGRVDKRGNPVVEVGETAQRMVLMAMAKHTNPTRDRGRYRCCPTVERIAMLTGVVDRQVQLVLKTHKNLAYITEESQGVRAGRNRLARPSWWELHPDRWPRRSLNGREAGFVANGDLAMVAKPASDGREAGHATNGGWSRSRPPENTDGGEAGFTLTRNSGTRNSVFKPENEPARAAAHAADVSSRDESKTDIRANGHQVALPLTSAVGLGYSCPASAAGAPVFDALAEGKRIWESARHQLLRPGTGVDLALIARARNTAAVGYSAADGVLTLDGDLVAEDLEPGSTVGAAVASAARGCQLELRLVGGARPSHLPAGAHARAETNGAERSDDEAAIRARLRSKLSAEELALIDELERQRVSYADGPVVPAANDQVDNTQVEQQRPGEIESDVGKTEHVEEAPRRRRKKATAAA